MTRAGERPEVVLEATYGWYWASDTLAECGAVTHLAHPLGVKAFEYRRVKNDFRDAAGLADLLRVGRPPPPQPGVDRAPAPSGGARGGPAPRPTGLHALPVRRP